MRKSRAVIIAHQPRIHRGVVSTGATGLLLAGCADVGGTGAWRRGGGPAALSGVWTILMILNVLGLVGVRLVDEEVDVRVEEAEGEE